MEDYQKRSAYQQNEYVGWINRAKWRETKEKRLRQMLEELERGSVSMKMKRPASAWKSIGSCTRIESSQRLQLKSTVLWFPQSRCVHLGVNVQCHRPSKNTI